MSLPFAFPTYNKHKASISTQYLEADERYEVYLVKAAERPYLLLDDTPKFPEEKKKQEDDAEELPLIDGCDIPGWRKEGIVPISRCVESVLNIGAGSGCDYFRRESQWMVLPNDRIKSPWHALKEILLKPPSESNDASVIDYDEFCVPCVSEATKEEKPTRFAMEYEETNIPAKIMNATQGWKAMPRPDSDDGWTFDNLLQRFDDIPWRFSDLHGEMLELQTYARYIFNLEGQADDSPLAIYDSLFGEPSSPTNILLKEYDVPRCFSPDLFHVCEERPPYRWILIGPERSGTGMHVDPLYTNAWVTVLQGKKRWMLFPPTTPSSVIGMNDHGETTISSVLWFREYYEKVTSSSWPREWKPVEVLQLPGETVFVPQGWKHVVLNLELTVAVTQNYASEYGDMERVWKEVCKDEPLFAKEWYSKICEKKPHLMKYLKKTELNES